LSTPEERRLNLAQQLLSLPADGSAIPEAQRRITSATCDAILLDFTGQIQRTIAKRGLGLPVIRPDGHLAWYSPALIREQIHIAEQADDRPMIETLRSILLLLGDLDPTVSILAAVADSSGLRVMRIPIEDPARGIRQLLDRWDAC
jgi:hypothetical protein